VSGPTPSTIKRLFAVSGSTCAFPRCRNPLYDNGVLVGDICHIKGNKPGAKRYDPSQSEAERQGFDNLILLCKNHHAVIDGDEQKYTVARLQDMKRTHEAKQTVRFAISDSEAMRLSLFAGGTVVGVLASSLGEVAKALVDLMPAREKQETITIQELLRRLGPGEIAFATTTPNLKQLGIQIVTLFAQEGAWKAADATPQLAERGSVPERTLVLLFFHRHDRAADVVVLILDAVLEALGIVRLDKNSLEWHSKERTFRIVLTKLERY
jgi:hypothetical protein